MVFLQSHGDYHRLRSKNLQDLWPRGHPQGAQRSLSPRARCGMGSVSASPDRIAQRLGLGHDAPERVQAGIRYLLSEAADEGHVYLPTVRTMELPAVGTMELPAVGMMERAVEILDINAELLPPALEALRASDGVVTRGPALLSAATSPRRSGRSIVAKAAFASASRSIGCARRSGRRARISSGANTSRGASRHE